MSEITVVVDMADCEKAIESITATESVTVEIGC